jgi:CBS domain-containing protein
MKSPPTSDLALGGRRQRPAIGKPHPSPHNEPTTSPGTSAMTTVADILKSKPIQAVHTIDVEASVYDAVARMAQVNTGALVVLENGQVVGMVSERDCARKVVLEKLAAEEAFVRQIMSTRVLVVRPDRTRDECMALMTENRLRHLPVMDGERLVGLVSIGDLVKHAVSEQQFVIEQLEHYISGDHA